MAPTHVHVYTYTYYRASKLKYEGARIHSCTLYLLNYLSYERKRQKYDASIAFFLSECILSVMVIYGILARDLNLITRPK